MVGIHETTVSRAVANKYMQTPRGMFEMKYFFTPGLQDRRRQGGLEQDHQGRHRPAGRGRGPRQPAVRPGHRGEAEGNRASPSPAAPSPSTATSSTSCPRTCASSFRFSKRRIQIRLQARSGQVGDLSNAHDDLHAMSEKNRKDFSNHWNNQAVAFFLRTRVHLGPPLAHGGRSRGPERRVSETDFQSVPPG